VADGEECWKLWDAASGVEWMAGARHDGTGACVCTVTSGGRKLDEGCPVLAHTRGVVAVAFSPCGQRLATGGYEGAVILWDAQTGNGERVMVGHSEGVRSVSFSAGGEKVACGSYDGSICVWEVATGALFRKIRWMLAVFSPDGRTIATLSSGLRDVNLKDAETGIVRLRFFCNQGAINSITFSPGGSKLATVSDDGSCKVWDSSTGALLRTIEMGHAAHSVAWGRDWLLDEKCVAFAMGQHPRLGVGSRVLELEVGVVRMILDRV
jgi:WD40 repeat protein